MKQCCHIENFLPAISRAQGLWGPTMQSFAHIVSTITILIVQMLNVTFCTSALLDSETECHAQVHQPSSDHYSGHGMGQASVQFTSRQARGGKCCQEAAGCRLCRLSTCSQPCLVLFHKPVIASQVILLQWLTGPSKSQFKRD